MTKNAKISWQYRQDAEVTQAMTNFTNWQGVIILYQIDQAFKVLVKIYCPLKKL